MEGKGSTQVGARLPGHIYRWLKQKVDNNDYPNMSQAVIGELTKAKLSDDRRSQDKSNAVCEPTKPYDQEAYIRRQIGDILGELREEVLKGIENREMG